MNKRRWVLSEGAKESGTFLSTLQAEVNAKGLRECVHHLKVTKHELWQKWGKINVVWGHIFNDGPEHRAFFPYIYDLKDGVPFPVFQNSDVPIVSSS